MTVFWWAMISSAASPTSANSALPTTFSSIPGSCPPRWTWSLAFHNNHLSSTIWLRSEEHTSELQSRLHLVCRLLLEKKKKGGAQLDCLYKARCSRYVARPRLQRLC